MKIGSIILLLLTTVCLLLAQTVKYNVDAKKCIGCTLCIAKCPVKAIEMKNNKALIDVSKCIGCGLCVGACPVKAIAPVKVIEKSMPDSMSKSAKDSLQKSHPDSLKQKKELKVGMKTKSQVQNTNHIILADKSIPTGNGNSITTNSTDRIVYKIDKVDCIGCKVCIGECPVKAIDYHSCTAIIDVKKCIGCGICKTVCPSAAVVKTQITTTE